MHNIVFLPATEPGDMTYGQVPMTLDDSVDANIMIVQYPNLVWYNRQIRSKAITQIKGWDRHELILMGFSKSGLGAWNITRTIPELITATIIFDAPAAREQCPPWQTADFYTDDTTWCKDQPALHVPEFLDAVPESHQLVLISGQNFPDEMRALSHRVNQAGREHVFLDRPDMPHHWNSGWIQEGLSALS